MRITTWTALVAHLVFCTALLSAHAGTQPRGVVSSIVREKLRVSSEVLERLRHCTSEADRAALADSLRSAVGSVSPTEKAKGQQSIQALSNTQVSKASEIGAEIHAAINPVDSNNLVCSAISSSSGVMSLPIYYTTNGGSTWTRSSFVPKPKDAAAFVIGGGDPMFAFDSKGTLYYSWIDLFFGTSSTQPPMVMYWAQSTNGGKAWTRHPTNDSIASGYLDLADQENSPAVDKQWMVCDQSSSAGRDNLYTGFLLFYTSDQRVALRTKQASSPVFSSASLRPHRTDYTFNQFSSVDCDDQGRVHMSYMAALPADSMPEGEFRIFHMRSDDHGKTMNAETEVSPIRFLKSSSGSPITTEPPVGMTRIEPLPQIACDKFSSSSYAGNVYLAWTGVGTTERRSQGTDIYFSRSTDHGATWSSPVVINDDGDKPTTTQAYVSMTVSPKGVVVLSWYDFRSDPNNAKGRYMMTYSFDGGKSFIKNFVVSSEETDFSLFDVDQSRQFGVGEYNQVVATAGYAMPFWGDARSGEVKIFTARVPISPNPLDVQGVEIGSVSEGISIQNLGPNPARDHCSLRLRTEQSRVGEIVIVDATSRVLYRKSDIESPAGEHIIDIPTSSFANGVYTLCYRSSGTALSRTLVIQR